MWILGGCDTLTHRMNDVWFSSDGINWTCVTDSAQWSRRELHSSVVFANKIWVLGGLTDKGSTSDVWYSSDGKDWTCVTAAAPWKRYGHTSLVYDNKIWILGGSSGLEVYNDVWHTTDGINWHQDHESASWGKRLLHTSVVFNNSIMIIGGQNLEPSYFNDVWYSQGGVNLDEAKEHRESNQALTSFIYPNPFHGALTFSCHVKNAALTTIKIYNSGGTEIAVLHQGILSPGFHNYLWRGNDFSDKPVPSGIYYVQIKSGKYQEMKKIIRID